MRGHEGEAKSAERLAFEHYLRTGRHVPPIWFAQRDALAAAELEAKFNPWHDRLGLFTWAPGGPRDDANPERRAVTRSDRRTSPVVSVDPKTRAISHADGSVTIPLPPRPELTTAQKIMGQFWLRTGRWLTVTSTKRSPAQQAAAMYTKFELGDFSPYRGPLGLEIIRAYRTAKVAGKPQSQIIADMSAAIEGQVDRRLYVSQHLVGRALDVRTLDPQTQKPILSQQEQMLVIDVAKKLGGKAIVEKRPHHIHITLPE